MDNILPGDLMSICYGDYKISLDKKDKSANINFISHAHSDHTSSVNTKSKFITSAATANLIKARKSITIDYSESISGMKLLNAGHILGSKQLYLDLEALGKTITYSGDYQMQPSYVAEPIEIKETEYLIIDSTYPYPDVIFDEKSEVTYTMQKYSNEKLDRGIVLFQTYSLGKAQEIIKILNESGIRPITTEKISQLNEVHKDHGVQLDYISDSKESEELNETLRSNFVYICEHAKFDEYKMKLAATYGRRIFTAVATGFAQTVRFNTDVQFGLSDHADFKQAREYIDACNPKIIYTYGGNARIFAENLKKIGYDARPYSDEINSIIQGLNTSSNYNNINLDVSIYND